MAEPVLYPDLTGAKMLSVDIETYDPELLEKGPGVFRQDGYILGVALSDGVFSEYYNVGHDDCTEEIKNRNWAYIRTQLSAPMPKLFANALYDCDWLVNGYLCDIPGKWYDVQIAEPLIDEATKSYSLDSLVQKYLGEKKGNQELVAYCEARGWQGDPRKHLYKMPYETVRNYGKSDTVQPYKILELQLKVLESEGLSELFELETALLPLLIRKMRATGVRIDVERMQQVYDKLNQRIRTESAALFETYGEFNVKSFPDQKKVFERLGLDIPMNIKGKPSFDQDSMGYVEHPIGEQILSVRSLMTAKSYLEGSIHQMLVGKRIHPSFYPLRIDDNEMGGGTVSGRFSGSKPNLQQVTHVLKKLGQEGFEDDLGVYLRGLFIPEEGRRWAKLDLSQIEYRLIAHYAMGQGADDIRARYNADPNTDYHSEIMALTGLDRYDAKRLNFGVAYSMGAAKMAYKNHWSLERAKELQGIYHRRVPFVKYTSQLVEQKAKWRDVNGGGYVTTILGRRARITPFIRQFKKEYTLFNRVIQGSAADIFKKSMVDAYNAGVFETLDLHLIVHDEFDVSFTDNKEGREAINELKYHMENSVKLKVPVLAELETGPTWAHLSKGFGDK